MLTLKLHYIFLCGALPGILPYKSIYLEKYSAASMSEIGALLAALPLLSITLRPLSCALAERHPAAKHKHFLMGALALVALGYGSLAVAPFLPQFSKQHKRLVWYINIAGVSLGYAGVVLAGSFGEMLRAKQHNSTSSNCCSWRLWALISWALAGSLGSQFNELHELGQGKLLPRYVPSVLLLVLLAVCEIFLLANLNWQAKKKTNEREKTKKLEAKAAQKTRELKYQAECHHHDDSKFRSLRFLLRLLKSRRDKASLGAHMILVSLLGFVTNCHMTYIYMYVERLCRLSGPRFSIMTSGLMIAHSVSEVGASLLLAKPRRRAQIQKCNLDWTQAEPAATSLDHNSKLAIVPISIACYLALQLYHATYLARLPLAYAIPMEFFHGLISAVICAALINGASCELANRASAAYLEDHRSEDIFVVSKKQATSNNNNKEALEQIDDVELKRSLQANIRALLSSTMDGFGGSLGSLLGGILQDHFGYPTLWLLCALVVLLVLLVFYPLTRLLAFSGVKRCDCELQNSLQGAHGDTCERI